MTDYQKLVDILMDLLPVDSPWQGNIKGLVEGLISNGVTFAEDNNVPSKWISVKDRLPEDGECVIVYDTREDYIGMWEFSGVAWYNDDYNPLGIDEVTHWMSLPQPPKGD